MLLQILKSKIHRVTVTEANLDYIGSITIDEDLMNAANIYAGEKVQIVDNTNGARIETYVIPGKRGSGCICINGAAAHLVHVGDTVIIMAYALMTEDEVKALIAEIKAATGASSPKDMGKIMKELSPKVKGRFDAKRASALVQEALK